MEALSCAHLGLLIAGGRYDAARRFAAELCAVAASRGLRRTLMRGLALSMVLEQRAGETAAAAGHLEAYLHLFAETPYMRPLIREREACAAVVTAFLESESESPSREAAQSLLAAMNQVDAVRPPELSEREKQVLARLGRLQDKQIAAELGLTKHGVRYHLRKLFTKLGANTRADALRRARETRPDFGRALNRRGRRQTSNGGDRGFGRGRLVLAQRCGSGVAGGGIPGACAAWAARPIGGAFRRESPGKFCVDGSWL